MGVHKRKIKRKLHEKRRSGEEKNLLKTAEKEEREFTYTGCGNLPGD